MVSSPAFAPTLVTGFSKQDRLTGVRLAKRLMDIVNRSDVTVGAGMVAVGAMLGSIVGLVDREHSEQAIATALHYILERSVCAAAGGEVADLSVRYELPEPCAELIDLLATLTALAGEQLPT